MSGLSTLLPAGLLAKGSVLLLEPVAGRRLGAVFGVFAQLFLEPRNGLCELIDGFLHR